MEMFIPKEKKNHVVEFTNSYGKRENKTFQIEENEYLINLRINWEPCRKVNNTLPYRCKNESETIEIGFRFDTLFSKNITH